MTTSSSSNTRQETIGGTPLKSAGLAAAGFVLSRLPVLPILGFSARVVSRLFWPTLLALGAIKAWDVYRKRGGAEGFKKGFAQAIAPKSPVATPGIPALSADL